MAAKTLLDLSMDGKAVVALDGTRESMLVEQCDLKGRTRIFHVRLYQSLC